MIRVFLFHSAFFHFIQAPELWVILANFPTATVIVTTLQVIKIHLSVKWIIQLWHYFCNFASEIEKVAFPLKNKVYKYNKV